jgi:hypothetical protein
MFFVEKRKTHSFCPHKILRRSLLFSLFFFLASYLILFDVEYTPIANQNFHNRSIDKGACPMYKTIQRMV